MATTTCLSDAGGAGFTGCDVLDQTGVNRIAGLATLLPQPLTGSLAPVLANSQAGDCPFAGPIWGEGNILLGGLGSDKITGRGADDVLDGDRALTVRISVRTNPADPATEVGTTDLMERQYLRAANGALTGPTLQAAVFAGTVDPGDLVLVREIRPVTAPAADCGATAPVNCDTAVFLGPFASYDVTVAAGVVTVNQTGALSTGQKVSDGIDTLRNVEALQFADQTVRLGVPNAPTAVTGLTNGTAYTFQVRALNALGAGPLSAASASVTPRGAPTAPTNVVATAGSALAHLSWAAAGANGTTYTFRVQSVNIVGAGTLSAAPNTVVPGVPGAPGILATAQGTRGWRIHGGRELDRAGEHRCRERERVHRVGPADGR